MVSWILFLLIYAVVLLGGFYVIKLMAKKTRDKYGWADEPYVKPPGELPADKEPPQTPPSP